MKPVRTKSDFVKRYRAGEFGNCSPTWDSLEDYLHSGYEGPLHIRNRVAGGPTWYDIRCDAVEVWWWGIIFSGEARETDLYISAMAPTDLTLFQGEVQRGMRGLDLHYTTVAKPMRTALVEESHQVSGAVATALLHHYLDSRSQDWLEYLLETYIDHVIELSTYDVPWGTVPGYNTCFWEVRLY